MYQSSDRVFDGELKSKKTRRLLSGTFQILVRPSSRESAMTLPTPQPVPILPEWLTPLLAIWGAFLSSVALGWNLYRDLRDRSKVQVSVRVRRICSERGWEMVRRKP